MSNSIVGLDIGATGIRAAEVTRTRKGPKLVRYHSLPLPSGVLQRGEVVEPQVITSALKTLWKQGRFSTNRVVLGIGNDKVIARELKVQNAPLPIIRESLPFQVHDLLPVPVAEAILDFYPISDAGHGQVQGLLVAAMKEGVLATIDAVRRAKLEPQSVDFVPFAISRALMPISDADHAVAAVDVGAHTTSVVIVSGGVPQFVRIIPTGGDEVTHALHARLGIDRSAAEGAKRALGLGVQEFAPHDQPAIDAIREVTGELVTGVRNTITYFTAARPELPVRSAMLTGDGASLAGFSAALAEVLRVPIEHADPFGALSVRERDRARTAADTTRAVVAVGLAMRSAA